MNWTAIGAVGTFIATAVALGGYFLAEWLRRNRYISDLRVWGAEVFQQNNDHYGRLIINNESQNKAVLVEADVELIVKNNKSREGFLPVPLNWTHIGEIHRTIYGNQTVYLDVFSYAPRKKIENENPFRITTPIKGIELFDKLDEGETMLSINFYQENGQVTSQQVFIYWDGENIPKIKLAP